MIDGFDLCPSSSSYMVFDSGYKYMYDKYNDVFRFVPLNGDTAGLCAYTDGVADPWFSPAGYNRGNVRGAIKLSFNPTKAERDRLYRARVNPVVDFPGQGWFCSVTRLLSPNQVHLIASTCGGCSWFLRKQSNCKFNSSLNDEFTREQFRNLVEPFLRDVQGSEGLRLPVVVTNKQHRRSN